MLKAFEHSDVVRLVHILRDIEEGGELFLGMAEDKKSRPPVAASIDGAPASLATDQLQQLIEGNVSPHLPEIRVHRVRLSSHPNRAVFVVQIQGGLFINLGYLRRRSRVKFNNEDAQAISS